MLQIARRSLSVLTVVVMTIVGFVGLAASPATAATATCGMTVTGNLQLDTDLTCPDTALIVGADGVTINLNGHTITGPGATSSVHGIEAHEFGVSVRNGVITGFGVGVVA